MARRIVWAVTARAEFEGLLDYVHGRNPQGVGTILRKVGAAVSLLAERPHGRPGRVSGTYEKTVSGLPYIVAYELDDIAPYDPTGFTHLKSRSYFNKLMTAAKAWGRRYRHHPVLRENVIIQSVLRQATRQHFRFWWPAEGSRNRDGKRQ